MRMSVPSPVGGEGAGDGVDACELRERPQPGGGVHSQRSIPVPEELAGVLRRHLDQWAQPDPGGLVFTNTYLGVTVDDAVLSISRFEDALDAAYDDTQLGGEGRKPSQGSRKRRGSQGRRAVRSIIRAGSLVCGADQR